MTKYFDFAWLNLFFLIYQAKVSQNAANISYDFSYIIA